MSGDEKLADAIKNVLEENGGYIGSQQELISSLDYTQPPVREKVKEMQENGQIEVNRVGRANSYFLPEEEKKHPREFQVLAKYILESGSSYRKTDKLTEEIESEYGVEMDRDWVGEAIFDMADYLNIDKEKYEENFKFGNSTPTTWSLGSIRENHGEKLEEIAGNPYREELSKIPSNQIYEDFSEKIQEIYPIASTDQRSNVKENQEESSEEVDGDWKSIESIMEGHTETEEQEENSGIQDRDFTETENEKVNLQDEEAGYEGFM